MSLDAVELELRRLPGVSFVGFSEEPDHLVVQLLAPGADVDDLRRRAGAIASNLGRPVTVLVGAATGPARVQIVTVQRAEDTDTVEVHLAAGSRRSIGRCRAGDPSAAAAATREALEQLGAAVPFRVQAAALFEHDGTSGVMIALTAIAGDGARYGAASAPTVEEAAVRATLHALNRHLAGVLPDLP